MIVYHWLLFLILVFDGRSSWTILRSLTFFLCVNSVENLLKHRYLVWINLVRVLDEAFAHTRRALQSLLCGCR